MTTQDTKAVGAAISGTPEQKTLVGMINNSIGELAKALPKHLSTERLARIATTAIRQNPKLAQCTPASFLGSLFTAAQLGLEPVAGLAYFIPFDNSKLVNGTWIKVTECQFVIGYKGVAELFYRHEKSGLIDWGIVHEKDEFSYEYGTDARLKHKPAQGVRGDVVGYYGIFKLSNGLSKFLYMTKAECMEHGKKHSKTYSQRDQAFGKKSPWATNPDGMCLKTVLLQTAKTAPMATELRRALDTDETSREFKDGITDALDLPVTAWHDAEVENSKELPKADTSKLAAAITGPIDKEPEPAAAAEEKPLSVVGKVTSHFTPTKKGPHAFKVGDFNDSLKTFDTIIAEALARHKEDGDDVEVNYQWETKGGYTNAMITGISVLTGN
jgi:recombination protein RecT